jgi:hypothetical protein
MKRKCRHVGAEGNLSGDAFKRSAQVCRAAASAVSVSSLVGLSPVSVGIVVIKVVVHCFDHLLRDLSSARSVKISDGVGLLCVRASAGKLARMSVVEVIVIILLGDSAVVYCWVTVIVISTAAFVELPPPAAKLPLPDKPVD